MNTNDPRSSTDTRHELELMHLGGNARDTYERRAANMDPGNDEDWGQDDVAEQGGSGGREGEEAAAGGSGRGIDDRAKRRTVRKLDFLLLPFLALLFLLNSMDKSNIGNAETAGFTRDAGLSRNDMNISMAIFFAFFVALQPVGAALGRKFGMRRYVPFCMTLWGLSTVLHIWVRRRWQLILLRIVIASLESGFYPTAVNYLSLFYTRYEFAVRLGFFYGQTAVAGALGGILSWAVFSTFPHGQPDKPEIPPTMDLHVRANGGWKSWQVLFLIEGCITMAVAFTGFVWLPKSAESAWFLNREERRWAELRIRHDRQSASDESLNNRKAFLSHRSRRDTGSDVSNEEDRLDESRQRLLHKSATGESRSSGIDEKRAITADAGLTRQDILSAVLNVKIWQLLFCNILSAIPATAFGVFLPLVMKQLSPALKLSPAASNLLTAPPFAIGAVVLYVFTLWSDRSRRRIVPILWSLTLLVIGLTLTVLIPMRNYILRYISLCILLAGSFIASPLTVAWLANNTPEPGKRAILLGINGWGNLAGAISSLLFTPDDEKAGYIRPFVITLICVVISFAGFAAFGLLLARENKWRQQVTAEWSAEDCAREEQHGDMPAPASLASRTAHRLKLDAFGTWLGMDETRKGDELLTFQYGY